MRAARIFWQQVSAIVWKDLTLERRTRQSISAMLVFSVATIITFNFAVGTESGAVDGVAAGLLWSMIWLAGTLGLNRSFSAETETNALDAIRIAPIARNAIYFGKLLGMLITILILVIILVPIFVMFFDQPFYRPMVLVSLLLGIIGYTGMGVFVSSMATQTRSSYWLIPILILPLTLPIVLAAAAISAEYLQINPDFSRVQIPLTLVITYDVLVLFAGYFAYNYVLED